MRISLRTCLPVLLVSLAAAQPHAPGGSPIITLEQLPDYLVQGEAVTLSFVARQHGNLVGDDRWTGFVTVNGESWKAEREGHRFIARVTPDRAGETEITLRVALPVVAGGNAADPGRTFMAYSTPRELLPIPTYARGQKPRPVSAEERGRRLFVAKGCIACHTKEGVESSGTAAVSLVGRRFPARYLEAVLANPDGVLEQTSAMFGGMPDLGLSNAEIDALTAFINRTASGQ